jgi:hypothetical protein
VAMPPRKALVHLTIRQSENGRWNMTSTPMDDDGTAARLAAKAFLLGVAQ